MHIRTSMDITYLLDMRESCRGFWEYKVEKLLWWLNRCSWQSILQLVPFGRLHQSSSEEQETWREPRQVGLVARIVEPSPCCKYVFSADHRLQCSLCLPHPPSVCHLHGAYLACPESCLEMLLLRIILHLLWNHYFHWSRPFSLYTNFLRPSARDRVWY